MIDNKLFFILKNKKVNLILLIYLTNRNNKTVMPSIITFNKSTIDRDDFLTNHSPYQIVPLHDRFFYEEFMDTLPNPKFDNDILIHSSFTSRPFGNKQIETSYGNLKGYNRIANRLRTRYILFHGPSNPEEYNNFVKGLKFIDKCFNNKIVCIEIPAFSSAMHKFIKDSGKSCYEFVDNYLKIIYDFKGSNEFQMVIDTAHMHANGLNGKEMFEIMDKYKDGYDFIHMNGNIKDRFKPDIHTQLDSIDDKIEFSCYLIENIVKLNKICVCETKDGDYLYYEEISKEYGYELVKENKLYSY